MNFDGKANLDMHSTVIYGKELLNEQLIPRRYHVPEKKTSMEKEKRTEWRQEHITILNLLNVANSFEAYTLLDVININISN